MNIVFMGTPEFSLNVLEALINSEHEVVGVVTQPDKRLEETGLNASCRKVMAEKHGIPVFNR